MCGIAGITNSKGQTRLESIQSALKELGKRGPDDRGVLSYPACTIGHTRLSIIDLSTGHQPMKDASGTAAITFNGEIYNYRQLRLELECKGHVFNTTSDTEVILKAYLEYGSDCVTYLDGMFAFGIWDNAKKLLFLARDRFGEKPLYFAFYNQELYFASEIKALLAAGIKPELDPVSLDNYLALLYVPPWRTIYKNIQPVKPAHYLIYQNGVTTQKQYWKLTKTNKPTPTLAEAAKTVRDEVRNSVESRMVADVEVGTFLSGGIDSSIVTRLAAEMSPEIKSFSAGFEGFINELPYAEEIARLAKTDHHSEQINIDLLQAFKETIAYFDSPFADSSNVPMQLLSRLARKKVKVALSGDGGDELFWGYGYSYTRHLNLPFFQRIKQQLFSNPFKSYTRHIQHFKPEERQRLWRDPIAVEEDPTIHVDTSEAPTDLDKINLVDIYMALPGDMLTKVDQSSMMHSLEVRAPFLNHRLAEIAYNLQAEFKANKSRTKIILQEAFKDLLPGSFFTRKKQGFGAPIGEWLMKPKIKQYAEEILLADKARVGKYFHLKEVRKIVRDFYAGNSAQKYKVWALLSLEEWLLTHPLE